MQEQNPSLGYQIKSLTNMIHRRIDNSSALRHLKDLSGTNGWIIMYISDQTEKGIDVFQKDLEDQFNVTRSTISKVIHLMEQKDLVRRESVDYDARLKKVVLTPKAQEVAQEIREDALLLETQLQQGFTEDEIRRFVEYLIRIQNNLQNTIKE